MLLNFMSQLTVNKAINFAPAAPDGRTSPPVIAALAGANILSVVQIKKEG